MSPYNPDIHHRRSIRLKSYDYASEGLYFVTICTQNRECLFGDIKNDEMVLNDAGRMVEKWYHKTHEKFPDIVCHEMIVMPNHFHCIWENVGLHGASPVGADPCVRPPSNNIRPITNNVHPVTNNVHPVTNNIRPIGHNDNCVVDDGTHTEKGAHMGAPLQINNTNLGTPNNIIVDKFNGDEGAHTGAPLQTPTLDNTDLGEHTGSPLSSVVRWFKTMSTNEYIHGVKQFGWMPFDRKLWQRNYYEHIIRDDASLQNIAFYIENNPANWQEDDFYQPPKMI